MSLSERFARLSDSPQAETVNLWHIEETLGEDGAPLLIIFLCIPFLFPMPLPGISTAFGAGIVFLALKTALARSWRLPKFVGKVSLKQKTVAQIGVQGAKWTRRVERYLKPRLGFLCDGPGRICAAVAMISSAIALAIPIPPVVPLTNTLPALAAFFLAVGLLTRDGLAVTLGHATHVVSWAYLISLAAAGGAALKKLLPAVETWWSNL